MNVHFSSKTDLWETPQSIFDKYDARYHFTLDVCANAENAKCKNFYTEQDYSLWLKWEGTCWMNPPYGRTIGEWMRKAYDSFCYGATVVCLVPARTDTNWWHEYAMKGTIEFLKGRLKFSGHKNSAPFPSAVVIYDDFKRMWTKPFDRPELVWRDIPAKTETK